MLSTMKCIKTKQNRSLFLSSIWFRRHMTVHFNFFVVKTFISSSKTYKSPKRFHYECGRERTTEKPLHTYPFFCSTPPRPWYSQPALLVLDLADLLNYIKNSLTKITGVCFTHKPNNQLKFSVTVPHDMTQI